MLEDFEANQKEAENADLEELQDYFPQNINQNPLEYPNDSKADLPNFFPNENSLSKTINQTAIDSESKFKQIKIKKRKIKKKAN